MSLVQLLAWLFAFAGGPALELRLTESKLSTHSDQDTSITTIALAKGELVVREHLEPGPYSGGHLPPDRERRRMLDAGEQAKARTILDESQVLARGDVDAGRPPGCGGVEYRLELIVEVGGKRVKRHVRGPVAAECWKPKLKFPMSPAAIGARRLVDGLKALVDGF